MKAKLYIHILRIGVVSLKNFLYSSSFDRSKHEAAKCLSEFLHYIPPLLLTDATTKGDAFFLESPVSRFLTDYPFKNEVAFLEMCDLAFELHDLVQKEVPVQLRAPEEVLTNIQRHRRLNK